MRRARALAVIIITAIILETVYLAIILFRPLETGQNNVGGMVVTTSFYPLYFFTTEIGKDKVKVANITPSGAEPHDYEPTSQDLVKIENSRLLIINGGVEPWAEKIKNNLKNKSTTVYEVGLGLMTPVVTDERGNVVSGGPHIWLSPPLAVHLVENITKALSSVDKANSAYYEENARSLTARLQKLDANYRQGLSGCSRRDIITSHAAFDYLAKEYGFNQTSIAGLSPDAEPSLKQLTEIAGFAKAGNLKYIFFESLVSPKLSQTLAREVGAKTLVLNPLEGLSSQDLKAGKDYFTVMESNLANLRIALSCQ